MDESSLIRLENVSKIFTIGPLGKMRIKAVDKIFMEIHRGEILSILGESGSGKSTIGKLILKILRPSTGRIFYANEDIWKITSKDYYKKVQGVFQDPYASFNPRRKVLDVLFDTLRNYYPEEGDRWEEKVREALIKVGLHTDDVVGKYPHEFSGGQLQRLSIARALLVKPELIIADEPVSMVDASTRIDILNIFVELKEHEHLTSVIIGHDLSLAYYVSDRVIILYRGQIIEQGPINILGDPAHPYTKMLLEAVPRVESKWARPLKYSMEHAGISNGGNCVFVHRCPFKIDKCAIKEPPIVNLGKAQVKCWLYAHK